MNNGKLFMSLIFLLISGGIFSQPPANPKPLRGNPDISVSPLSLEIELEAGQISTQTFTIYNSGDSELNFQITAFLDNPLKNSDPQKTLLEKTGSSPHHTLENSIEIGSNRNATPNNVLIFRDRLAWNLDTNLPLLESLGAVISIASSDEMATIELSDFDLIIFESQQPKSFYNNYQDNRSRFEDFLNSGGNIEFHCATKPGDRIPNLEFPEGIQTLSTGSFDTYNFVTNSSHPILKNLPDSLKGNSASHEAFKNIPAGADTLTINESGQPTSVAYNFGEGKILLTGMAWEIANNSDWNFGSIVPKAFQYMLGLSGKLDWLSWNPVEGTILPGAPQIIEMGFDATNLYPGIYLAEVLIRSNDSGDALINLPITLTVTGQNPPLSLTALLDEISGEVALAWEFPRKDAFLQFNIYRNGFLLNSTNSTSYFDFLSAPGTYDYKVSALYLEGESLPTPAEEIIWEGLPNIVASPSVFEETIQSGEVITKNIIISNNGESKLHWNAAIQNTGDDEDSFISKSNTNFLSQDKIEEIIFKNEDFKNSWGISGIGSDEILDAHPGESREIILVCVVDGGNFSTETWDYLNLHWAEYGQQELLIDYSSLSGIGITYPVLSNCGAQVLMIDNNWNAEESYGALSEAECQAIAQYVNEGVGLFVTGGTLNERQFPELNFQTQYFAPLLGIDPEAGFMWNRGQTTATNLLAPSHPIFQNLGEPFGNSITGTTCRPLSYNWLTAVTNGDILAISDNNETAIIGYENRIYHSSAPILVPSIENIQFAYNVINYCAIGYVPLDWLSASPHFGSIHAGNSDTIEVILGNPNLYPDFYTANISLTCNDPNNALINIQVSLHVEGLIPPTNLTAELDVHTGEVALSWEFPGTNSDSLLWFYIYRNEILIDTISSLFCSNVLPNAGTYTFEVTALFTDGESAPTAPAEIIWEGKADISVEPEFIIERLGTGQSSTRQLNISNTGEGELRWAIDIFEQANGDNQGGTDTFGYYWIDSDEPGGPEFSWFDISEIGNNTELIGDDEFVSLELPFSFEFYGQTKNEIKISSNGYLTFGNEATKYHNDPIPLASEPNDLIAPFWDDLMSGDSGVCYSYFDETKHRLIIQYSNWAKYNAPGVANFQVHLHQNGSIYFYYHEFTCDVNQSTTGIENSGGSDGLFIAMDGYYLHDHLAIKIVSTPAWIKSDQLSGIVFSDRNEVVDINFDTGELDTGDYFADLIITSNDPFESSFTVPITLTITTGILPTNPSATLNDKTGNVDLSWDFEFDNDFLWFNIYRDAVLIDTSTRLHYADFLPGAGTYQYEVSAVKTSGETLPSGLLEVKWEGLADISVEPGFLEATLGTGQSSSRQLTISNAGEGKLEWALDIFALSGDNQNNNPKKNGEGFDGEKSEPDPRKGNPPADGQGGLDAFGYSWIDSDEPGGPEYAWLDISEIGSNTLLSGDDVFATLALPFDFWFYGQVKNEVLVSSNGYLTFGDDGTDYTNDPIPSGEYPNDLIAPFWTDMKSGTAGTNYSWYDEENKRFIIQYSNWEKYDGAGQATFQVHLYQNGTIYFYYENMTCDLCEATVGIENMDGSDGLEIVFNAYYLHNQLAVKITSTPKWLTANTLSGIINSGENQVVDINFDATDLDIANYLAEIVFSSDDPEEPKLTIPVSLTVGEFQVEEHILSLNQGWTGISSFLNPANPNIEIIMDSISGQLEIIQNLGAFYQPDNASSTLGSWNTKSGYFVKVNEETALVIQGIQGGNKSANISEGWNLIPVLSDQAVNIETLFAGNLDKVEIIKDAVGTDIFWPQKNIATLTELKPGRAYLIKASGEFVLLFFE